MRAGRSAEWVVRTGLHSPSTYTLPTSTGSYEAAQSTISVEPTLLSLNGAHHTKCEQPRRGCIGHYSPLFADDPRAVQ